MYPHYALFDEERRESDEGRLWFWNSMHFPLPMPAFDVASIDGPYYALGAWQNRAFAVPPAMGIDYRVVNGYIYISVNPVTDPAKIAERAEFFQKRAGHYFAELGRAVRASGATKMETLLARAGGDRGARRCPSTSRTRSSSATTNSTLLQGARRATRRTLRMSEMMWQHHFEFLLLGYGAYLTFADFCKQALPDIPDQHIAQMVAGHRRAPVPARRRAAPAGAAGDRHRRRAAFVERAARPARSTRSWPRATPGAQWLEELEGVKDPWFNMGTGDGLYHYYRSWHDDPSIPYASIVGHIAALEEGRRHRAPDRGARARARPARRGLRRAAQRRAARPVPGAARASRARCSRTSRSTSSTATTGS